MIMEEIDGSKNKTYQNETGWGVRDQRHEDHP
jgi:hypothetical protein